MRFIRASKALAAGLIVAAMTAALPHHGAAAPRARPPACGQPAQGGQAWAPLFESPACAAQASAARKPRAKRAAAQKAKPARQAAEKPAPAAAPAKPPPSAAVRPAFTGQDQLRAVVPGVPEARFWADSETEHRRVLGDLNGPWLALSAGGEDSAFGAGLLSGLAESGRRPDYVVVTGVSSGALLAPFVFLGPTRDPDLKRDFTAISAADVFEDRRTVDSLLDTWPLREFVEKRITPQLLTEIAAEHRRGRRLIIVTTNIDAARPVAWNMGAIAEAGSEAALKLFRDILVATSAIPGLFPPVLIEAEADGRKVTEMHADGGLAATVYVAPDSMLLGDSPARLPASQVTLILNTKLVADFEMTDRSLVGVLGRSLSVGVKRATRTAATLIAAAARRSEVEFNVSYIDQGFDVASRGLFDPKYMTALFEAGLRKGKSENPFHNAMPEPAAPTPPHAAAPAEGPTGKVE